LFFRPASATPDVLSSASKTYSSESNTVVTDGYWCSYLSDHQYHIPEYSGLQSKTQLASWESVKILFKRHWLGCPEKYPSLLVVITDGFWFDSWALWVWSDKFAFLFNPL
jgi:hypothetical protein